MINLKLDSNQTKIGLGVATVLSLTLATGYFYSDSIKSLFSKSKSTDDSTENNESNEELQETEKVVNTEN